MFVCAYEQGPGEEEPIHESYGSTTDGDSSMLGGHNQAQALVSAGRQQCIAQPSQVSFIILFSCKASGHAPRATRLKIPEKSQQRKNTCT